MDVTSTPSATTTASSQKKTSSSGSSEGVASNALTGDFDTFIQLLTAQMNNQDPLEPTSNTEFVAQLASFSAVEQQIMTNQTLSSIMNQMGFGEAGQVGSWIGKEVLVKGGLAQFSGEAIDVQVEPVKSVDKAVLLVRDQDGLLVAQTSVKNGATKVTWDGTDTMGNVVDDGLYSFSLESSAEGKVISTQKAAVFSEVTEVRLTEDGTQLIAAGGVAVNADDVTAIR
jgi:flagellar basal-body rod modification protein FlgD